MNKTRMAVVTVAIVVIGALFLAFAQERKGRSGKEEQEHVIPVEAQVSVLNGQTVITLSAQAEKLAGIVTAPLEGVSAREQIVAPAVVLSVEGLAKLRASAIAAETQLAKARAQADVSRKEYARLKMLYQENQNVSLKALQSAEGTWRSDQADVQAAQQQLTLGGSMVREQWGGVVEQWMQDGSPMLERVLDQQEVLVEVTVPADKTSAYPANVQMEIPGGHRAEASFVSLFPHVDPRIQGVGLLYRVSSRAGLVPGTYLNARLPVGRMASGVEVPSSAIVWAEGKSWVYQETARGRFVRRPVEAVQPEGKGFFVRQGLSPGDKIVVRGAQGLLSQEFRSEIQPED
jgi:hypothetical protein